MTLDPATRAALDAAPLAVVISTEAGGVVLYANAQAHAIAGLAGADRRGPQDVRPPHVELGRGNRELGDRICHRILQPERGFLRRRLPASKDEGGNGHANGNGNGGAGGNGEHGGEEGAPPAPAGGPTVH